MLLVCGLLVICWMVLLFVLLVSWFGLGDGLLLVVCCFGLFVVVGL